MDTIRQVLERKGGSVWTVSTGTTVYAAVALMAEKEVGALLVMDGERLAGVVSERDYARKIILRDRSSKDTLVDDIMTSDVIVVSPGRTVQEGLAVMTDKRVRHLPVMDGQKVLGIVSIGDLVKSVIAEQQFVIEQLERYIAT